MDRMGEYTMAVDDLLKQGIAALNEGRREEAHNLLAQVVKQDANNEIAWLWLSGVVDTNEERRICLENVLSINPNNGIAQRGLEALQKQDLLSGDSAFEARFDEGAGSLQPAILMETGAGIETQPGIEELAPDEVNEILRQAATAIKSGDKEHGRQLLLQVLEADEDNELAWMWMAVCVDGRNLKRKCFQRVLEINPDSELAQKGLQKLDTREKAKSSARKKRPKKKRKTDKKSSNRTRVLLLVLCAVIVVGCAALAVICFTLLRSPDVTTSLDESGDISVSPYIPDLGKEFEELESLRNNPPRNLSQEVAKQHLESKLESVGFFVRLVEIAHTDAGVMLRVSIRVAMPGNYGPFLGYCLAYTSIYATAGGFDGASVTIISKDDEAVTAATASRRDIDDWIDGRISKEEFVDCWHVD